MGVNIASNGDWVQAQRLFAADNGQWVQVPLGDFYNRKPVYFFHNDGGSFNFAYREVNKGEVSIIDTSSSAEAPDVEQIVSDTGYIAVRTFDSGTEEHTVYRGNSGTAGEGDSLQLLLRTTSGTINDIAVSGGSLYTAEDDGEVRGYTMDGGVLFLINDDLDNFGDSGESVDNVAASGLYPYIYARKREYLIEIDARSGDTFSTASVDDIDGLESPLDYLELAPDRDELALYTWDESKNDYDLVILDIANGLAAAEIKQRYDTTSFTTGQLRYRFNRYYMIPNDLKVVDPDAEQIVWTNDDLNWNRVTATDQEVFVWTDEELRILDREDGTDIDSDSDFSVDYGDVVEHFVDSFDDKLIWRPFVMREGY